MAEETPEERKARQDALKVKLMAQREARKGREAVGEPVNRLAEVLAAEKRMKESREAEEELRRANEKQAADMKKAVEGSKNEGKSKVNWAKIANSAKGKIGGIAQKAASLKQGATQWAGSKLGGMKNAFSRASPAAKGAVLTGIAAGGVAMGATGAMASGAGSTVYSGVRGMWRLSRQLFMAINVLFVASFLFHVYDIYHFNLLMTRGMVFIIFALYAWLFIFSKHEQGAGDVKAMIPPMIISLVAILLPIILLNVWLLKVLNMRELFYNVLILCPVLPIVIMFGMPTTRLVRAVRIFYVLFLFITFIPMMWYSVAKDFDVGTMQAGVGGELYQIVDRAKTGGTYLYESAVAIPSKIMDLGQQQIQYAVGDYYTGQVEQGKNEPIGVYIEDIRPVSQEFYADDVVVVWATLIARTLDPDKTITVTASCSGEVESDFEVRREKGDADPLTDSDIFVMDTAQAEEKYITCEFPSRFFTKGPRSIFVNAEFNFETMAYIKAYFMNLDTLRSMTREGIDPLDQYKITDKKPQAIYTNGPISIGMETSEVPIGLSSEDPIDIKLGVTIDNRWEGQIKEVNDIMIKIPEQLEIVYCDHAFEKVPCAEDECEEGKYASVYKIKKSAEGGRMGLSSIKDIKAGGYHSIACRMRARNINALMGNYPLVTEYFKVTSDYVYELEKSAMVSIKEPLSNATTSGTNGQAQISQKPRSFSYNIASSSVTLNVGQKKEFSVSIQNPGVISYGWASEGVKEEAQPDATSYIFSSDQAGAATVSFVAIDDQGKEIERRSWAVDVIG